MLQIQYYNFIISYEFEPKRCEKYGSILEALQQLRARWGILILHQSKAAYGESTKYIADDCKSQKHGRKSLQNENLVTVKK